MDASSRVWRRQHSVPLLLADFSIIYVLKDTIDTLSQAPWSSSQASSKISGLLTSSCQIGYICSIREAALRKIDTFEVDGRWHVVLLMYPSNDAFRDIREFAFGYGILQLLS